MLKSGVALHQRPTTTAITRGNSGGNSVGANTKNIYISNGYELSSIVPITTSNRKGPYGAPFLFLMWGSRTTEGGSTESIPPVTVPRS